MSKSLRLEIGLDADLPKRIIELDEYDDGGILSVHAGERHIVTALSKAELLKLGEMINEKRNDKPKMAINK